MRAVASQWNDHVKAGGAGGLDERRKLHFVAQRSNRPRDADHHLERRLLRIEIDDAPIGLLNGPDATGPDVERDASHVGQIDERVEVVADEVSDLPLSILAPHPLSSDPGRNVRRSILLKK